MGVISAVLLDPPEIDWSEVRSLSVSAERRWKRVPLKRGPRAGAWTEGPLQLPRRARVCVSVGEEIRPVVAPENIGHGLANQPHRPLA